MASVALWQDHNRLQRVGAALISRFGTLGRINCAFLLRSDNGLVFTSRRFTALVRSYGLRQEFITPHGPQQTDVIESPLSEVEWFFSLGRLLRADIACQFSASAA